jgi:hypothetical protein
MKFEIDNVKNLPDLIESSKANDLIRCLMSDDSVFERYSKVEILDSFCQLSERYANNYHLMADRDRDVISKWLLGHFDIHNANLIESVCYIMVTLGLTLIYQDIIKIIIEPDLYSEFSISVAKEFINEHPLGVENPYLDYPDFSPQKAPPFLSDVIKDW